MHHAIGPSTGLVSRENWMHFSSTHLGFPCVVCYMVVGKTRGNVGAVCLGGCKSRFTDYLKRLEILRQQMSVTAPFISEKVFFVL